MKKQIYGHSLELQSHCRHFEQKKAVYHQAATIIMAFITTKVVPKLYARGGRSFQVKEMDTH